MQPIRYICERLERRCLLSSGWDVALIDKTLPAEDVLERAMVPGGRVILYDGQHDSPHEVLARVTAWAEAGGCKVRSVSLLSHASAGRFALGNEWVSKSSVEEISEDLGRLGRVMSEDGSINLYGCNLADRLGDGEVLIDRIADLTKASVFASTNATGRGGDWVLEAASRDVPAGQAARPSPFSKSVLSEWPGTLLGAGITVTPTSGLVTTENGATATFTVVLDSNPGGNTVSIGLSSSNPTEGTVSTATLTFNNANWNTPQTVTITGVDDLVSDGNVLYSIITAPAVSGAAGYNGLNAADVSVTNVDNDTPGITVNPTSGLTTTEAGGTATFTVMLNSQPSATVSIPVSSGNAAEGTVSTSNLTFTTANWATPQTVTVTGVNDFIDDGDVAYTIVTGAAVSTDGNYSGLNPSDVSVTNVDNDTAGFTVSPTSGLTTTEAGGTASFTVVLNSQPTADVTVGVSSSNTAEGTVSVSSLTFTSANWNTPRTVTLTGVDDFLDDGNVVYTVVTAAATSADSNYNGLNPSDVSASNTDDDTAGITVTPTSGLVTTEAGGTATFNVVLTSQPTANVTIGLSSSNTAEGTVSPATLTFTSANWNVAQTVTATGVNDFVDDGDIAYTIVTAAATSGDAGYSGRNAADVSVTNTDNDTAGITVSPTSGLTTTEAGGTATFTVVLNSQPTANVTVPLSSSNTAEGTVSPATLTFTAANWSTPQTVTVTGVNDFVDDGDIAYSVITGAATSTDGNYGGVNASDVAVTNTDDDTAGITVTPTSGLTTTEAGGTATFTVVLDSKPTASVTIGISSGNTGEGTVSAASLTFTTANWNTSQTLTVTGVNDFVDDGDVVYSIVTAAATSADANYSGRNASDVSVTNVDNDTAGITVNPTSGLTTTEAGGMATFTVVLDSQPTASVSIGLSSSNTAEGTVSAASLTFTAANWNTPQTLTVTGVDDSVDDGDVAYTVITAAATSGDANYSGRNAADVSATNVDNDTAGIAVSPTSGLTTTEAGGTATFTVVLNSQPTANVTIGLSSSNTAEGTVGPASLTFTASNWNIAQTVTVTGVDDFVDDANVGYTIVTAAATSADGNYSGLNAADVSVTNTDDDTAGITVSPTSGLTTTEAGGTATFTIVLNSQPTAGVTVGISSGNTAEGTVAVASVTFTAGNWNIAQTVTVIGVDDFVDDGNVSYTIVTAAATSVDSNYNGLNPSDVTVSNTDDDTAGITVSPTSGLTTTEAGGTATFTVVLTSQPTANVTIGLSSSNTAEGTVGPSSLTFTAANWSTPQTVTVTGVNDAVDDGDVAYTVVTAAATSGDGNYNGRNASDVSVTNVDNDTAGITVSPTSGLTTTEAGGTATFTVVLNTQPTANVTVPLSSGNTAEGTVSVASLTFTAANWSTPQTVTVTGVNDFVDDGDVAYTIVTAAAISGDGNYSGLNAADVGVTNTDNDTAGVTVTPTSGLTTTEAGGTATFTLVLDSQPTANVTISLASSNTAEGTVGPASITFTAANWNVAQTVTVTGVDDPTDDDDVAYTIVTGAASSPDASYGGMTVADVSVTNSDNDTAGFTLSPASGLITTEAGGTATFTIVLNSRPTADVTVGLTSSDVTEGTVTPASVTFTSANWNAPQTITVTGVDDFAADGNVGFSIVTAAATSVDSRYSGLNPADVSATNVDNDALGITVTPTSGLATTEAGGTAAFTVRLNTQPTADVVITLASSDTAEGTVLTSNLTFTAVNWATPQTVTVTGVDDFADDGDVAYTIITSAAASADLAYDGMAVADVSVTNADNDTAGVSVSPTSGLVTTEAGGTTTISFVLTSRPTANVTFALSSSNTAEGTVSAPSLTFTSANWNVAQVVTLTGVDDAIDDGNVPYTIVTAAVSSTDPNYNGLNPADVSATNTDDDTAGITVTPAGLVTTEAGGSTTFTVVLTSQPTANVTIPLSSSNSGEGSLSATSLTFTAANWATPQTVTVTGVNDFVDDGDVAYTVVTAAATSGDGSYSGLNAADLTLNNTDDDTAGITVMPTSGLTTSEAGGTTTFIVVLNSQPTANVSIALSSSNTAEGTPSVSSLTFTPANWNVAQTVTVTGVNDYIDDGNVAYTIVSAAATSGDANYSGLNASDVSLSNTDDDTTGITVTPTSGLTTTEAGGTATFTVVLTSQPTANVTIGLSSSNTAEGTLSTANLTFTAANWNTPQTVTITGVDDFGDDGDVAFTATTAAGVSGDANYNGLNPADVSATNVDDDTAGFTVTPTSGLTTTEAGGTSTFTVVLNSRPTANVTLPIASSNTAEGTVSAATLTFTPANWNLPQTLTVTGVDDFLDDGDVAYTVITSAAGSTDTHYSGLDPSDVSLTNSDDDTAGVSVTPTSGLTTTEVGGSATFTVVLTSQPTANVTIPISSSNLAEGTVSPTSLTFTPANWNVPRTITLTGVNDFVDDGDVAYSAVTGAATSADTAYSGLNPADVSVTNTDDDTAGITVTPTAGLTTTEAGGTASFTLVLTSRPTASVIIGISSSNPAEGTTSLTSVTFTAANWNTPQTVTVTGANDFVDDGNIPYTTITAAATSGDPNYNGLDPADVSVSNTDDDTAAIVVSPTSGRVTSEAGGTATFTVVLASQPTADVVIPIASSNTAEGSLSAASLTFTSANWNVAQTVTITGVDDFVDDGNVPYTIVTSAASSADPNYNGLNPADVSASNTDDDTAGITVSPTSALTTTEAGATAAFTLVLQSQPTANVTIALTSSDTTEGTVGPASVTFTAANWNTPQTITLTGVDDFLDDGDIAYSIVTAAATSADANYNGLNPADVTAANTDDDAAGITVTPTSGVTTSEAGGTATFTVALTSQPTANVTIPLTSSNTAEGTVAFASLTFTAANWNTPQTVTVTGANDFVDDGDIAYTIVTAVAVSTDPGYSGRNAADVSVTNTDDDTAGITVSPPSGLTTTEAGGSATFTLVLNSRPTANVTIALSSSNTAEGTISLASVTFTSANWNVPRTITVTGADDFAHDGDTAYTIVTAATTSTDPLYDGVNPADVSVTNTDDDIAGVTITPTSGLTTTEAGSTATFTVALDSKPAANVTINLASSNTAEGTLSTPAVTFTTANWNLPQTVTLTGVDDDVDDGNTTYSVLTTITSADPNYTAIDPADVSASNTDDDTAGITVTPTSGLSTTEAGGTASFTVVLNSQPTADVTIPITSGDASEASVSAASLTFTAANWYLPQTVTVTGADDLVRDGDVAFSIVTGAATSADPNYNGRNAADVTATNSDDDVAEVIVTPFTGLSTTEAGGTATFTIVLTSQPTATVSIALSSSDLTEGAPSPSTVTFDAADWSTPHVVTVTGVNDPVQDGDIAYTIVTAAAVSADPFYSGINAADVAVTNLDNDVAGVTVTPLSGLSTTESGGTASFTVVLDTQPSANVRINLSSSDLGEATLSASRLTFTAANWNVPQTVTVTGVDDFTVDGDQALSIVLSPAVSADTHYNGLNPANVSATNQDDDVVGVTVTPTSGLITRENGAAATFTLVLTSQPAANVSISLNSSNTAEGVVANPSITFTPANWNVPQQVTVNGVDDALLDDDIAYTVLTAPASSADPLYNAFDPADVTLTNIDNDSIGIKILPLAGLTTSETGGSVAFNVLLAKQPTANVTLRLLSSNTAEGIVSRSSLTFTVDNWDVAREITMSGVNDLVDDDDVHYDLVVSVSASADPDYAALPAKRVTLTNTDDDTAGFTVTAISPELTGESGTSAQYDVVLNSRPRANVYFLVKSRDTTEGLPAASILTFTPTNWNVPHTLTINGVDDPLDDGDIAYRVKISPLAENADAKYAAVDRQFLHLINTDDDTAGLVITPETPRLITTESGGQAHVTVVLRTKPAADVRVTIASTDPTEGTVSRTRLIFTPDDWDQPRTIVITGLNDTIADGDTPYDILVGPTSSLDPDYDALAATTFPAINTDDDVAAVIVTQLSLSESEQTLAVRLGSRPATDVQVDLSLLGIDATVTPGSLTFSRETWNQPQTITLTFAKGAATNGSLNLTTTSSDPAYANQQSSKDVHPATPTPTPTIPLPAAVNSSRAGRKAPTFSVRPAPSLAFPLPHRRHAQPKLHSGLIGGLDPVPPQPNPVADVKDPQDTDATPDDTPQDIPDDPSEPPPPRDDEPAINCAATIAPTAISCSNSQPAPASVQPASSIKRRTASTALKLLLLPLTWLGVLHVRHNPRGRSGKGDDPTGD